MSAANELMTAIHARLSADARLLQMIGPDGIRDRPISGKALPCIVIGEILTNDYSTSTEKGAEHFFAFEIWAETGGRRLTETIADRLREVLDDIPLTLETHRLVSLQHRSTRSIRDAKTKLHVAEMRWRAVTE